jgi:hypothetical protein
VPLQDVPPLSLQSGSPLLYGGLAGLFIALLATGLVLVGLFTRSASPEAQRERSLAVYSMRGAGRDC